MRPVIATALKILAAEVGVRESNDNSGKRVMEYQATTTLGGTHWPWCGALLSWGFKQTAQKLGVSIPWNNSASTDIILADGRARGLMRDKPEPGDVGLVRARKSAANGGGYSKSDMIHTFIVERVLDDGRLVTIEGNTNDDGGREGVGVMRHTFRKANDPRYFWLRWADAVADPTPAPELPPYTANLTIVRPGNKSQSFPLPVQMENGSVLVGARAWGEALGKKVDVEPATGAVLFDGEQVPYQPHRYGGVNYFWIRELGELSNAQINVDASARAVEAVVSR